MKCNEWGQMASFTTDQESGCAADSYMEAHIYDKPKRHIASKICSTQGTYCTYKKYVDDKDMYLKCRGQIIKKVTTVRQNSYIKHSDCSDEIEIIFTTPNPKFQQWRTFVCPFGNCRVNCLGTREPPHSVPLSQSHTCRSDTTHKMIALISDPSSNNIKVGRKTFLASYYDCTV